MRIPSAEELAHPEEWKSHRSNKQSLRSDLLNFRKAWRKNIPSKARNEEFDIGR
jgi:hypothetical protein